MGLLDLPTSTSEQRAVAVSRFGSKGSNLAPLYQRIDARYQLPGFVVPMSKYRYFVETAGWTTDLGGGPAFHTFAETLNTWLGDSLFRSDGRERRSRLEALRTAMANAPTDVDLTDAIRATFGSDTRMLRFRSSSNAEDAVAFSGKSHSPGRPQQKSPDTNTVASTSLKREQSRFRSKLNAH